MPLYDFQCEKCQTVFEVARALGSTAKVKCPACGSLRTTKMFSAAGIVFKGSGFYVTDSKTEGKGAPAKPSTGESEKVVDKPSAAEPAAGSNTPSKPASDGKVPKKGKTT